jgi:hypothetical protein
MAPTTPTGWRTSSELPDRRSHSTSPTTSSIDANDMTGSPACTSTAICHGAPISVDAASATSCARAFRPSAIAVQALTRSSSEVADHAGSARAAARAARSTSSTVPSGTVPTTCSVNGFVTGSVPVPVEGIQAPST